MKRFQVGGGDRGAVGVAHVPAVDRHVLDRAYAVGEADPHGRRRAAACSPRTTCTRLRRRARLARGRAGGAPTPVAVPFHTWLSAKLTAVAIRARSPGWQLAGGTGSSLAVGVDTLVIAIGSQKMPFDGEGGERGRHGQRRDRRSPMTLAGEHGTGRPRSAWAGGTPSTAGRRKTPQRSSWLAIHVAELTEFFVASRTVIYAGRRPSALPNLYGAPVRGWCTRR